MTPPSAQPGAPSAPFGLYLGSVYDLVPPPLWAGDPDAASAALVNAFELIEAAGVTVVVLDDSFDSSAVDAAGAPSSVLDAVVVLSFVSQRLPRLSLVAGSPIATLEPYHVAKRLQTLDNSTRGHAGWLVNPARSASAAALFDATGAAGPASGSTRPADVLARDVEFVETVIELWDSWEPGSLIRDTEAGIYLDPDRVHHINHVGPSFTVRGPSLSPRSPQGRPPIFVKVVDETTAALAGQIADIALVVAGAPLPTVDGPRRFPLVPADRWLAEPGTNDHGANDHGADGHGADERCADAGAVFVDASGDGFTVLRPTLAALAEAAGAPHPGTRHLRDSLGLAATPNTFTAQRTEPIHA